MNPTFLLAVFAATLLFSAERAATLTVGRTADGGTGPGGNCALRRVTGTAISGDTIDFSLPAQQRTILTLADRVAYQRVIEEVYWRHRVWPKERSGPKPSLTEVMSSAQLEKKVGDYLRNSEALENYWRPPSAKDLQAEVERMAQNTKQPEVLRELFEALGNDPFVIAECLARPALSERLLTNLYTHDKRFHGQLRQHAEADLQAHNSIKQMKQTGGKYYEIELVRSDDAHVEDDRGAEGSVKMNSRDWDENVRKLKVMFDNTENTWAQPQSGGRGRDASITQIKTGLLSPLQEDEDRYYATGVVTKSKDRLKLAMVEWRKEPLESWRDKAEPRMPKVRSVENANYRLPTILDGTTGCVDDTWTATSTANAPLGRYQSTAIWTGSEMIIWGGSGNGGFYDTGGRYNPATDSWATTSTTNSPPRRDYHTAVWTGSEMIIWGGQKGNLPYLNSGGRYNPATDSWTFTSTTNAPSGRFLHTAVWTDNEMIVWGGYDNNGYLNTGGRYNPDTDSWTATSITNAPVGREEFTAVWTGSEMIVWGGFYSDGSIHDLDTGGRYNPSADTWTPTAAANAPSARNSHTGVWTGSEMIVWGGFWGPFNNGGNLDTGARYNPATDNWTATSTTNPPTARRDHMAVWTGSEMIIWGGFGTGAFVTGGRYDPGTDSWTATSTANAPVERVVPTAVWTGSEMIVWGGLGNDYLNTGGRYCAQTPTPMAQSAFSRKTHGAAGTFDVPLPLTGTLGIECRSGGASNDYQVVFVFPSAVTYNDAAVTAGEGSVSSSSGSGTTAIIVNLTGVTNAQRVTVTLFGVSNGNSMGDVGVQMGGTYRRHKRKRIGQRWRYRSNQRAIGRGDDGRQLPDRY